MGPCHAARALELLRATLPIAISRGSGELRARSQLAMARAMLLVADRIDLATNPGVALKLLSASAGTYSKVGPTRTAPPCLKLGAQKSAARGSGADSATPRLISPSAPNSVQKLRVAAWPYHLDRSRLCNRQRLVHFLPRGFLGARGLTGPPFRVLQMGSWSRAAEAHYLGALVADSVGLRDRRDSEARSWQECLDRAASSSP